MGKPDRPGHQLWSVAYLAVRRVLSLVLLVLRTSDSKEIEILVGRHELEVLGRNQPRPPLEPADRAWLAALSRLLAKERWSAFFVRPETLLRWHRRLVARHWTYPRRRPGRLPIGEELAALIVAMALDNPTWGYQRIRGELLGLRHRVAASTIARVLKAHGIEPAPRRSSATWCKFLRQQAASIVACDLFSVDTVSLRRLYVLFFIHHDTRRVFFAGITTNPTWAWVTQAARNVTAELRDAGIDVEFLLADRDAKFAPGFDALWHGVGARILRGPLRAPRERDRRALGANGPIGVRRPSLDRERRPSPPGARPLRAPLQPAPAAPGPCDGRAGPSWKYGVADASEDHTHPPARGTRRADQRVSRRTSCSDKFSDPTRSIRRIAVGASSRSPLRAVDS